MSDRLRDAADAVRAAEVARTVALDSRAEAVREAHASGMSLRQIAQATGLTLGSVQADMRRTSDPWMSAVEGV